MGGPYKIIMRVILEPQTFSNLHSAESEQLDWREFRPERSQFLFKRNHLTVNSACLDWMYVLARVLTEESSVYRETTQNNLLFPVTVLPTAT